MRNTRILSLTALCLCLFIVTTHAQDETFQYSQTITLNTTTGQATLQADTKNFPVLIKFDNGFDFSKVKTNGSDIRFYSADGTSLPYTIDKWENGSAQIWVLIPKLKANNSQQYITFKYGCNDAVSKDQGSSVFKDVDHDLIGIYSKSGFIVANKSKDNNISNIIGEERMK